MTLNRTSLLALVIAGALVALPGGPALADAQPLDFRAKSLSGNYLAGRHAGTLREMENAAHFFAEALDDDPGNPVLVERAFILDLSAGNLDRAEKAAAQVIQFSPQHRMSRIVLGLKEVRAGRLAEAREHLRKAAFTPVGELTSGLLIAWVFAKERKQDEALKALDILDNNDAFANFKILHSALIADYLGDREKADNFYKQAYEQAGTSLRIVEAYGDFLRRAGRPDEARDIYAKFLAGSPNNPLVKAAEATAGQPDGGRPFIPDTETGMAEALFNLASALTDDQSIDVSLIYTQLALSLKPDFPVAQTLLGEIYEDTKRYGKAIEAYEVIPESSPLWSSAEIQIAINLNSLDREKEAIERISKLIAREPGNYEAMIAKGNIERMHEKWLDAAASYTRALSDIGEPQQSNWTILYFRGIAYERAGEWDKAEADFRQALKLEPDQASVLNYLGYSLIEKRLELDEAMEMVRKAVELKPNDGYIVDSLGWAHYQLGDYEEAVKHLERAVELRPEDPTINDHLGDAYWRVGRQLEAKFQWKHAKDNKPEPKDLEKIEKKLTDGLTDPPIVPALKVGNDKKT